MRSPDYEQLKTEAKRLHRDVQEANPAALKRLAEHGIPQSGVTRADCLHVIAKEHGFPSWPRLKLHLRALGLTREQRVRELEACLADGQHHIVDKLLEIDPGLSTAHFGIQLALIDTERVFARLVGNPSLATTVVGKRTPLLHLCFSRYFQAHRELQSKTVEIADRLLDLGADPNDSVSAGDGSGSRLSALYAALGHANNVPLAELLLRRGADPNDNESLYHAAELPNTEGLSLLYRFGARTDGTNALYRALDFEDESRIKLMLAAGADPNEPLGAASPCPGRHDTGNSLTHAVRRLRSGRVVELLLEAGADPTATHCGHTAYAIAAMYGNQSAGEVLTRHGCTSKLSLSETFVAAVVNGDGEAATAVLRDHPSIAQDLDPFESSVHTALAAFPNQLTRLRRLQEAGFDPHHSDDGDMPPYHFAAWRGDSKLLAYYLRSTKIDVEWENTFGGTLLSTAVHGSAHCPREQSADYPATIRLILHAGGTIRPDNGDLSMGSEEVTAILLAELGG